jgi:triosephosphate isomerase (TIM)
MEVFVRRSLIAGNWKMYKTLSEGLTFAKGLRDDLANVTDRDILVCPPAPLLAPIAECLAGSTIAVGAQNVYFEAEGAFTGEWSCSMVTSVGATYVIIGHSERRTIFGESDALVQKKVGRALGVGLTPIMCVGETLQERERAETFTVLMRQIRAGLAGLTSDQVGRVVIAYEPVWAIGTGKTATPEQGQEAHVFIREELGRLAGTQTAAAVRILYGGSVKPDNVKDLLAQPDIDGALVGGASLKRDVFATIVRGGAEA